MKNTEKQALPPLKIEYISMSIVQSIILFVVTLGMGHVLIWIANRKRPSLLHHRGVTLMNGQVIEWKKIQRVVEDSDYAEIGSCTYFRFEIDHGSWRLMHNRVRNQQAVIAYISTHLPEGVQRKRNPGEKYPKL